MLPRVYVVIFTDGQLDPDVDPELSDEAMVKEMGARGYQEAMARLGLKPQTLYAYVSRGAIRSVPQPSSASLPSLSPALSNIPTCPAQLSSVPARSDVPQRTAAPRLGVA